MRRRLTCVLILNFLVSGTASASSMVQRVLSSRPPPLIYSLTGPRTALAGKSVPLTLNVWNPSPKVIAVNIDFCADFLIRDQKTNRVVFDSTDPVHHYGCPALTAATPLAAGGTTTGTLSLPPLPVGDYTVRAAGYDWGTGVYLLRVRK